MKKIITIIVLIGIIAAVAYATVRTRIVERENKAAVVAPKTTKDANIKQGAVTNNKLDPSLYGLDADLYISGPEGITEKVGCLNSFACDYIGDMAVKNGAKQGPLCQYKYIQTSSDNKSFTPSVKAALGGNKSKAKNIEYDIPFDRTCNPRTGCTTGVYAKAYAQHFNTKGVLVGTTEYAPILIRYSNAKEASKYAGSKACKAEIKATLSNEDPVLYSDVRDANGKTIPYEKLVELKSQ